MFSYERVSVSVAVAAGLALHLLFVLALFPFPLDLAAAGAAEFEFAFRIAPAIIAAPATLAALVLPGMQQRIGPEGRMLPLIISVCLDAVCPMTLFRLST